MSRSSKDPTIPRKNRELAYIEKLMAENWREFRKAEDFTMKRGYAAILNAHLEAWLDEPEFLIDLKEGVAKPFASRARSAQSADDTPENAVHPFDEGGEAGGIYFYAGSSTLTELLDIEQVKADPRRPYRVGGFVITCYEKLYATRNETAFHFTSDEAFQRHVKPARPTRRTEVGDLHVLMDAKGYYGQSACKVAYRTKHGGRARNKADDLANRFGIRFLVARVADLIDTH